MFSLRVISRITQKPIIFILLWYFRALAVIKKRRHCVISYSSSIKMNLGDRDEIEEEEEDGVNTSTVVVYFLSIWPTTDKYSEEHQLWHYDNIIVRGRGCSRPIFWEYNNWPSVCSLKSFPNSYGRTLNWLLLRYRWQRLIISPEYATLIYCCNNAISIVQ